MAHAHKGIRYGGRECVSKTGKPAKTTSLRMRAEYWEFISSRISAGDARSVTEYLMALVREDASRLGIQL